MNGANGLISGFIRHANAANLLMVLMILFGIFALLRINTQFFPTVDRPSITVRVSWPGASAEDVEANVLAVIEPEVRFINNVDKIHSYGREGSGSVVLEFDEGVDMQKAVSEIETAVKAITTLPVDSETPIVSRSQFFDSVAKLSVGGNLPEAVIRRWAKRIRDDLIDRGIDRVDMKGLRRPEIEVLAQERDLRRFDLSIREISSAIAANSVDLPSGNIDGTVERQIRALSEADTVRGIDRIEVKALSSGEKIHISDLAQTRDSFNDDDVKGRVRGDVTVQLTIMRVETADTLATAKIFKDYVRDIRPQLPEDLVLQVYDVRADSVSDRIWLLVKNGASGLVLVVAILFLFLNARIAFWVAAGIPVALMATLGLMYVSGQTINMITLFALIMMLGVIVDDAIVVGEHTDTRLQMGDDPMTAAQNGARIMIWPVMAAMTTTVAAFAPMLLITDIIGQIIGVMPYVVMAVIAASLIECFLILPGHLAHALENRHDRPHWSFIRQLSISLLIAALILISLRFFDFGQWGDQFVGLQDWYGALPKPLSALLVGFAALALGSLIEFGLFKVKRSAHDRARSQSEQENANAGFRQRFDHYFNAFRDGPFRRAVELSYNWRYVTVAVAVASFLIFVNGLIGSEKVKFVFFPSPEAENIRGVVTMNAGTAKADIEQAVARYEQALFDAQSQLAGGSGEQLVSAVFVTLGEAGRNSGDNLAQINVRLTSSEVRTIRTPQITKAWRQMAPKIDGTKRFSVIEVRGGPPGRDIDVQLLGGSAAELKRAAEEVADVISAVAGVSGVSDDLPYGKPELIMSLTPRGAALGFTIEDVGRQVRNAFEGAIARRYAVGDEEVSVRVRRASRALGTNAIRNFELRSPAGNYVPLTEVVSLTEGQGFGTIQRENGKSKLSVSGDIDTVTNTTDGVIAELTSSGALDEIAARHGVSYKFGGRAEEQKKAFADLAIGTIVAMAVIYIVLAWVFGSYWRPIPVMLIIPFGVVGTVIGHWVLGMDLTILSLIGLLGLSGILVNDSIILVARLDERQRINPAEDIGQATIGASLDRLRAVLLTSLTTIGGLLPLLYEKSLQAQFLLPMAVTIVFGLASATLLVLFLVPAFIGIGADIGWLFRNLFGRSTSFDHREELQTYTNGTKDSPI